MKKQRGHYKQYLEPNSNEKIPASTLRTWRNKNKINFGEPMDFDENNEGQIGVLKNTNESTEPFVEIMVSDDKETEIGALRGSLESPEPCDDHSSTKTNFEETYLEKEELDGLEFGKTFDTRKKNDSNQHEDQWRQKAYNNIMCKCTNITMAEILLLCLQIFFIHSLTMTAFIDILKMINFIFGVRLLPETKYMLRKILNVKITNIHYHLFCCNCNKYLGKRTDFKTSITCECGARLTSSNTGSFFLEMDVEDQLKRLFSDKIMVSSLQHRFSREKKSSRALEDIYDGKLYKQFAKDMNLLGNPNNFSYIFNTDGCQTSFHSKITVWPIYIMINELPENLRKKNMILAGLWVAKTKPDMVCYLEPFVDTANRLSTEGFKWMSNNIEMTSKLFPLGCCVDSTARCSMLNMKQFNGYNGCTYCDHPGEKVSEKDKNYKYPMQQTEPSARTSDSIKKQMCEAHKNNEKQAIKGVWGPSALMNLKHFDLVKGMIVDFMHSCLLGVIQSYTEIILTETGQKNVDSQNQNGKSKKNDFYIGSKSKLDLIDARLLVMRPPTACAKSPKSIKERHMWKASDWLNWLLFYSLPCLKGILKDKYLNNLALFVAAMHIFLQDSIKLQEIRNARILLKKFVCQFQDLYGKKFMVYNIHLLLHLADAVKYWGPLWSANTFPFESQNNIILKMKKCNYRVAQQIVNRYFLNKQRNVLPKKARISENVLSFSNNLHSKRVKNSITIANCHLLGPGKPYALTKNEETRLNAFLNFSKYENVLKYNRIIYNSCRYTTLQYSKNKKNNDSPIMTTDDQYGIISKIVKFESNNVSYVAIFMHELILNDRFLIDDNVVQIKQLIPCDLGNLTVISPNMISKPCIVIRSKVNSRHDCFVSPLGKGIIGKSIN